MRSTFEATAGPEIRFGMTDEFSGFRLYFPSVITARVAAAIGAAALDKAKRSGHREMEATVLPGGPADQAGPSTPIELVLGPLNVRLPRAQARDEIYDVVAQCLMGIDPTE